jgi:UPF0716 protein FxsA
VGKWLLVLFTVVPLVETFLLYTMGQTLGFWWAFAFLIATALIGTFFGKREGLKVWREWRDALSRGQMPEEGILGGVLVLVGAVLLVTPGVLTDVTGLALLIPVSRKFIAKHVRKRLEQRFAQSGQSTFQYRVGNVDVGNVHVGNVDFAAGFSQAARSRGSRTRVEVIDTDGEVVEERRRGDPKAALEAD